MKRFWKVCTYLFLVLICLEIALHIYNPFSARVKNGNIVLPVSTKYALNLPEYPGMDRNPVHTKNKLGFRGPELSDSSKIKIICMGGSTTECFYLNDGKDWPSVLGSRLHSVSSDIWLNNAGMDGQSTFGHIQMLKQYILKLKPDYIVMMCGLNDMELDTPGRFDENTSVFSTIYNFLELPSTIVNLVRAGKAKEAGLNHNFMKDIHTAPTLVMNDSQVLQRMQKEVKFVEAYKSRLKTIIKLCKDNGIQLVFVAQSILFSDEKDLFSNVYLGDLKTGNINGKTRAYILKMYNKATYDIAGENEIPFINLAARLPKDSRFFYDGYHFTNDGSEMAAGILFDELLTKNTIKELKNGAHIR